MDFDPVIQSIKEHPIVMGCCVLVAIILIIVIAYYRNKNDQQAH